MKRICINTASYITDLCMNHTQEIIVSGGLVLLSIVGVQYMIVAIGIWVLSTAIDLFIGGLKALYINRNFDSRVFGRSIFKRSIVVIFGGLLTIIAWHLAALFEDGFWVVVIGLLPVGYFHLFTLQEITSILEHRIDIDPKNWATRMVQRFVNKVKQGVQQKIDDSVKSISNKVYDFLSPNIGKKYLKRTY